MNLKRGFKKNIVIANKTLMELDVALKATNLLDDTQIDYEVYDAALTNQTITDIREAVVFLEKAKADCIIATGGDSTIYLGKAV